MIGMSIKSWNVQNSFEDFYVPFNYGIVFRVRNRSYSMWLGINSGGSYFGVANTTHENNPTQSDWKSIELT